MEMSAAHEKKFLHALLSAGAEHDAVQKLLAALGSFEAAWRRDASELENAGISPELAARIVESHTRLNPDEALRALVGDGIALVTADESEFPRELREIAAAPVALYIKGKIPKGLPRLAVVGTRMSTAYGREATRKIVRDLADAAGMCIVSGLAQGIDGHAHRTALESGLPTVGVLGGGMNRGSFFPPEHWQLGEEIVAAGGAVVSEYPPGSPALPHHFPARNRIIAGLAADVLVIEAPEKSGALITARFALEQGRDVFAVPAPIFSPTAEGVHRLIQDGAKLVGRAEDILDELGIPRRSRADTAAALTEGPERTILSLLDEPRSVDELKEGTSLATPDIISCLSLLEIKGLVRPMGQNRFQRIS